MYETTTKQLLHAWGEWLAKTPWDYFSTYTFRYDISLRRNESYMQKLEKSLEEQQVNHKIFWVVEPTSNGYQSHSHFLIQGETAKDHVFEFYRSKNLINPTHVVNDPYQVRKGAEYYISKTLHHKNAVYGISYYADLQ